MKDLTNMKFGRWTVLKFSHRNRNNYYWVCQCSCDLKTLKTVNSGQLNNGESKSCGCLNKEIITKHGLDGNKIYHIFNSMKNRCYSDKNKSYNAYGGRGITICEEWLNDVTKFVQWADENGYEDGLSIDRIDVNGNYCPKNCRWVDRKVQANNTRTNIFYTHNGKTQTVSQWAEEYKIKMNTLYYRLVLQNWNIEEALTKPVGR